MPMARVLQDEIRSSAQVAAAAVLAILAAACSDNSPQPLRTTHATPKTAFKRLWTSTPVSDNNDGFEASPAITPDGNRIVLASANGFLLALRSESGETIWKQRLGEGFKASPLINEGKIFIGDINGDFKALDLNAIDNGPTPLWTKHVDAEIAGKATAATIDGRKLVLFGAYDNKLHCLDASNGKGIWEFTAKSFINGSPVVSGKRVFFGGCDGFLRCLDLSNGREIWNLDAGNYIPASPILVGGLVVAACRNGQLLAAQQETGEKAWNFHPPRKTPAPFISPPIATGPPANLVLAPSTNGTIFAIDANNGTLKWTIQLEGTPSTPLPINGALAVATDDSGLIHLISLKSGHLLEKRETGTPLPSPPIALGDTIFAAASDGAIHAFHIITPGKDTTRPR